MLLNAGYEELARRQVGDASGWTVDREVDALLQPGRLFHWFVLAERREGSVKSPIESFGRP